MRYRLSQAAENDIVEALAWSQEQFGDQARRNYEALIVAALRDMAADPIGAAARERPELGPGVLSWHLRASRSSTTTRVGRPRHLFLYRLDDDMVVVGRMLHDAMELERHMEDDSTWG